MFAHRRADGAHQEEWQAQLHIAEVPRAARPSTLSRLSFLAVARVIEVETPFDPGEETLPGPKADVFPSPPPASPRHLAPVEPLQVSRCTKA